MTFIAKDRSKLLRYLKKSPTVVVAAPAQKKVKSAHAILAATTTSAVPRQQVTTKSDETRKLKMKKKKMQRSDVVHELLLPKVAMVKKGKKSGQKKDDKKPAAASQSVSVKSKRQHSLEQSLSFDVATMIADYHDNGLAEEDFDVHDDDDDDQDDLSEPEVYEEVDDDQPKVTLPKADLKNPKKRKQIEEPEEVIRRSTELGSKARQTLATSMFRSLNEFLYTNDSSQTRKNFTVQKFKMYHEAYDKLMADWPLKPIDYLIDVLMKRIKPAKLTSTVIADVGCGSRPRIAESFPKATVYSYDLHQNDPTDARIISADMSRLPLDSAQADYVVYSLSLMPTNLKDCIREANRILKIGGYMLIVEVASRFADYQSTSGRTIPQEKHVGHRFAVDLRSYGFQLTENEELKPNGFFIYLCFKKTANVETLAPKSKLPPITLKACLYKAR